MLHEYDVPGSRRHFLCFNRRRVGVTRMVDLTRKSSITQQDENLAAPEHVRCSASVLPTVCLLERLPDCFST
jgi:hypothetical protein